MVGICLSWSLCIILSVQLQTMEDKDQATKGRIGVVISDVTWDKQHWDRAVNLMITIATSTVYVHQDYIQSGQAFHKQPRI